MCGLDPAHRMHLKAVGVLRALRAVVRDRAVDDEMLAGEFHLGHMDAPPPPSSAASSSSSRRRRCGGGPGGRGRLGEPMEGDVPPMVMFVASDRGQRRGGDALGARAVRRRRKRDLRRRRRRHPDRALARDLMMPDMLLAPAGIPMGRHTLLLDYGLLLVARCALEK